LITGDDLKPTTSEGGVFLEVGAPVVRVRCARLSNDTIAIELEEVNEPGVAARNEFTRGPRI
jgi:hypothetical protein